VSLFGVIAFSRLMCTFVVGSGNKNTYLKHFMCTQSTTPAANYITCGMLLTINSSVYTIVGLAFNAKNHNKLTVTVTCYATGITAKIVLIGKYHKGIYNTHGLDVVCCPITQLRWVIGN
jgi:hypothetical protein